MVTKVVGVKSGFSGLIVEVPFDEGFVVSVGDEVVFRDDQGEEYGVVEYNEREQVDKKKVLLKGKLLRKATPNDVQVVENNILWAQEALTVCDEVLRRQNLEMSIFRVGLSFDGLRAHFLFTAEDRVDFRELLKDMAKTFKKQINLKQIGPRDKAKMLGGYGKCGRPLCCNTWISEFQSINMEMVRVQALESKGSSKLSGVCGKLLCCLKYEVDSYKELRRELPRIGQKIRVEEGVAAVLGVDVLNQRVKVVLENGEYKMVYAGSFEKI